MANTQGVPTGTTYREAAMTPLYPTSGMKAALYLSSATTGPSNTAYTATGEVSGTGYTAGGITCPSATAPTTSGSVTYWTPSGSLVYPTVSIGPTDCVMIYDTAVSNANRGIFTFGAQTLVAGTLTLTMPTNNSTTALVRWTWS
jgi:hypothetical protein